MKKTARRGKAPAGGRPAPAILPRAPAKAAKAAAAPAAVAAAAASAPTCLSAMLADIQARAAAGAPQAAVIARLRGIGELYGIRVRTDDMLPGGGAPAASGAPAPIRRVIMSSDKRGRGGVLGRNVPLFHECNGLVLDADTWQPRAVPPLAFSIQISAKEIDPLLRAGAYDVIRVDDGTVCTLYPWGADDEWAISTSNAYDISTLHWMGPLTYAEMIHEVAGRYAGFAEATGMELRRGEAGPRLCFSRLDRGRCYSFGFRHHGVHPLRHDPERMWQIQSCELATLRCSYDAKLPVIPPQQVYTAAEMDALAAAAGGAPPLTLAHLRALGAPALEAAMARVRLREAEGAGPAAAAAAAAAPPPAPDPAFHYGYILRRRPDAPGGNPSPLHDRLIETTLLRRIRTSMYEGAPKGIRAELTWDNRERYNAMRAYLTANEREPFLALYPQWAPAFARFGEFVRTVESMVIHALRQRAMHPSTAPPALDRTPTGCVAASLLEHIIRTELNPFVPETESVVRDYVVNPEYAWLYVNAIAAAGRRAGAEAE